MVEVRSLRARNYRYVLFADHGMQDVPAREKLSPGLPGVSASTGSQIALYPTTFTMAVPFAWRLRSPEAPVESLLNA